jgi:hypothetical protein
MSLTDTEASEVFEHLSNLAREADLGWVVDQVEAQIALGKTATRKVSSRELSRRLGRPGQLLLDDDDVYETNQPERRRSVDYDEMDRPTKRRPPSAEFTFVEQYTEHEQLGILLDAIDLAVPVVTTIATRIFTSLSKFSDSDNVAIGFEPERESKRPIYLSNEELERPVTAADRLRALITEIRGELRNATAR